MSTEIGFVLYTDGGASHPYAGFGIHGYYYEITENKKGAGHPKFAPTRNGYVLKSKMKPEDTKDCKVVEYIDGYGALQLESTNNMAEITGLIKAYEIILAAIEKGMKVVEATFLLDSEYTRKSVTEWLDKWVRINFVRPDGTEIKNRALWEKVKDLKTKIETNVAKLAYIHVNSHQSEEVELGNNTADRLATLGQTVAKRGDFREVIVSDSADGYWKYQPDRHPLMAYKYCYFQTSKELIESGRYYTGNQSFEPHLFGQRGWDNAYSILETTTPDKLVDSLREKCVELSDGYTKPAMVRLNDLYNPTIHRDLTVFGLETLNQPLWTRCDLMTGNEAKETPIVRDFVPPMTANYGFESLAALNEIFKAAKENNPVLKRLDITDQFYIKAEKPEKTVIRSEIRNGITDYTLKVPFVNSKGAEVSSKVMLLFGADIPTRNSLKRIETMSPKVEILWWPVMDGDAFRYAIYIETVDSKSIFAAVDSNTRILC